jgi:hypothetical protein
MAQRYITMVSSTEYQEIHVHREQGMKATVVMACKPGVGSE